MDEYTGFVMCPLCSKGSFFLKLRGENVVIICRGCGYVIGQAPLDHIDHSWTTGDASGRER